MPALAINRIKKVIQPQNVLLVGRRTMKMSVNSTQARPSASPKRATMGPCSSALISKISSIQMRPVLEITTQSLALTLKIGQVYGLKTYFDKIYA